MIREKVNLSIEGRPLDFDASVQCGTIHEIYDITENGKPINRDSAIWHIAKDLFGPEIALKIIRQRGRKVMAEKVVSPHCLNGIEPLREDPTCDC